MRMIMNFVIIFLATLSFAACEKNVNLVSSPSVVKSSGVNGGTFEVTYNDYKNTSSSVTLTGTINFNFDTDTYSYNGVIINSDKSLSGPIHDSGTYTITENTIDMYDNAAKMMNPAWQPSLYLSGTYSYRKSANQLIIEGNGQFGAVRIILNN